MFDRPQTPALPQMPPAPPNPPMFGADSAGTSQVRRKSSTNSGFASTILGGLSGEANTSRTTLLGA